MNTQGQGAIEYLLIIAAAILVVAIVILAVTGALSSGQEQGDTAITTQQNATTALYIQQHKAANHTEITGPISINTADLGKTYFLSGNITQSDESTNAIYIEHVDNVTIDCLGFTIIKNSESMDDATKYAVQIRYSQRVTLKNCNIQGVSRGLYSSNSGETTPIILDNVTISNSSNVISLHAKESTINLIETTMCPTVNQGIHCSDSTNITVTGGKLKVDATCLSPTELITGSYETC